MMCQLCLQKYDGRAQARIPSPSPDNMPEETDIIIEQYESEFEGLLNKLEEQVSEEEKAEKPKNETEPPKVGEDEPKSKRVKILGHKPQELKVQCWRCLIWLPSQAKMTHDCLANIAKSGTLYTCRYCGLSSEHEVNIIRHVSSCSQQEMPILKLVHEEDNQEANNRDKKKTMKLLALEGLTCSICDVEFECDRELLLHDEKPKCFHVSCRFCSKNFATIGTHDNHACFTRIGGVKHSATIARIDNINDIKNNCFKVILQTCFWAPLTVFFW